MRPPRARRTCRNPTRGPSRATVSSRVEGPHGTRPDGRARKDERRIRHGELIAMTPRSRPSWITLLSACAAVLAVASSPPPAGAATASPAFACPCTAFQAGDVPSQASVIDNLELEIGVKFRTTVPGFVTAIRYYRGPLNEGAHTAHLWAADGRLLASAPFTVDAGTGWQETKLDPPVAITANTTFVASYHSPGSYAFTGGYFASALVRDPIRLLQNGEDGGNGVYAYGPVQFPTQSFSSSNYWVDIVFATSIPADATPPAVATASPAAGAAGVPVASAVVATFTEPLAAASVSATSVSLHTAAGALVPAAIAYDAAARRVTLTPATPLAYATTYTFAIEGGASAPHVTDLAGNPLASRFTASFTTAAAPVAMTAGPGGPVLVVTTAADPFSTYAAELLRAEGLTSFAMKDLAAVTVTDLNAVDAVVLGAAALTPAQVTLFTNFVTGGGTLVAFRPDKQLASLLGLTDAAATLANAYVKVNATGAGIGIESQTMQFHGTADLYTLSGATAVATLYSNATTATPNPAVSVHAVGASGGEAIAFTYDLSRSVVWTRQGNPAWSGQDRDALPPIRSDDLFYGNSASDPQPDWIDFAKIAIPQADEQQRLLANLLIQGTLHRKPLPRFAYFPSGVKAVVVLTGDEHRDSDMMPRFDTFRQLSPAGCSAPDWECVRATGYQYLVGTFTPGEAAFYNDLGFESAPHVTTNCLDFTAETLDTAMVAQIARFEADYPLVPEPVTNRTHCIAWSDWSTGAEVSVANGIRLDTNYYYWPGSWVQNRPGLFTGSGMPMRFAKTDGSLIDCYQLATQITDESNIDIGAHIDSLLDRATGPRGYYGAIGTNLHFDNPADTAATRYVILSAQARGVPVVSSRQLLEWVDGRNASAFGGLKWGGNTLSFTVTPGTGARHLYGWLPRLSATGTLATLTRDGAAIAFTPQTVKGLSYAAFVASPGLYAATYATDATAPTNSSVSDVANSDGSATVTWTSNEAASSRIDYGTAQNQLTLSVTDPALVTAHSMKLTGLLGGTKYFYRVTSTDASLNATTTPRVSQTPGNFTTVANAQPVASVAAVPASGAAPLIVKLSGAASTDANNDSLTFTWSFGDGGAATGRVVTHTYAAPGAYAALLTVTDGRGGKDTASVSINATALAFPQFAVLDDFNRADGEPGAAWGSPSAFTIASGQLAPQFETAAAAWRSAIFLANQEAFVRLTAILPGPTQGLLVRVQGVDDAGAHVRVMVDAELQQVIVSTFMPPSTFTTAGILTGVPFAAGDQLGVRVYYDGQLVVYRNGAAAGTVSIAGWPYAAAGGRIGVVVAGSTTPRFDDFGGGTLAGSGVLAAPQPAALPAALALSSAYPNPSHGGATLSLALPRAGDVSLDVLDVLGRRVWNVPAKRYPPGMWTLRWDGRGTQGPVSPGIYLLRVQAGGQAFGRRVAIIR